MNRKQLFKEAQEFLIYYHLRKIADNRNHALTCECTGVPLCTLCKANKLVHDIDHLPH